MSFIHDLIGDLREKRLWPVAVVLVGALIAVPVLLAKPAPKVPIASTATPGPGGAAPPGLPVISVASAPTNARLHGHARDPFTQHGGSSHTVTNATTSTTSTTTSGPGGTGSSTTGLGGTGTTGSAGTGTTGGGTTGGTGGAASPAPGLQQPTIPLPQPTPTPPGLTATESYHVTVEITNARGGVDKLDPLQRLSILPRPERPLLVELGVLKGGNRVLFVLQPGAVVSGPGRCQPGRIDCKILSLGLDEREDIWQRAATGTIPMGEFAVTGITADHHGSVAAARSARRKVFTAGQRLLRGNTDSALSLFQYELGSGAVIDQRNLTVGAS
ncbi:MAG: hypothetical protein ACJ76X_01925 [Solirubrobacteraceae bacterium]